MAFVLTYVTFFVASWAALALGLRSPWIVRLLTTPDFYAGARAVVPISPSRSWSFGAYVVVLDLDRTRRHAAGVELDRHGRRRRDRRRRSTSS